MFNTEIQDLEIKLIEQKNIEDGSIYALFEIEPLERGFGITLGNTLRRICLSHLEGTAVTAVRIPGVSHEFTTISGVQEDIVEIILNTKTLVFRSECVENFTITGSRNTPGELKAFDLNIPAGITLINPDTVIATLTDNTEFNIEITAGKGTGYRLADEQIHVNRTVDTIVLDSSFMPIRRFSYRVEQTRIGESSEASSNKYEKLIIEMISNGSIDPNKALAVAGKLLLQRLTPLLNLTGESITMTSAPISIVQSDIQSSETGSSSTSANKLAPDYSDIGIETLNLSVRAYNCLKRANKNYLQDLLQMTSYELMHIKNFGKKSAEEVIQVLNDKGFYLIDDSRRNG